MTEFFKNNPIALRYCLLYEFLHKKPVEESFNDFCKTVGPDVIKKEEFQVWFDKFSQGIFDMEGGKEPIKDMIDVFRSDKYALRACILYESLKYTRGFFTGHPWPIRNSSFYKVKHDPSFFTFNNFCNVVGRDVMEYRKYDVWFYRFLKREFDLNYERDKNKKIYKLMDMPIDVMENIVEYLDIFDRTNLVRTSRSLQTFVEDQKLFHEFLGFKVVPFRATVSVDPWTDIEYTRSRTGCVKNFKNRKTCVEGVSFWKEAILDFKNVLKNPKLHLDILEIGLDDYDEQREDYPSIKHVSNELEDVLKFTHYLNVKELMLLGYSSDKLSNVLQTLKPGYLETIYADSRHSNVNSMEKVFEMEQWKQAKCFEIYGACFIWPLHHLYHFKEFTVRLEELSLEDIREMKEVLFKSPHFETCLIWVLNDTAANAIEEVFGDYILQERNGSSGAKVYHYPIPNSTEYFNIDNAGFDFEITRKKR